MIENLAAQAPGSVAVAAAHRVRDAVLAEVRKAVVGQDATLELILCGVLAGGHVLPRALRGISGLGSPRPLGWQCEVRQDLLVRLGLVDEHDEQQLASAAHAP